MRVGILSDPSYELHLTGPGHPERPSRAASIRAALADQRLLSENNRLMPRSALQEEIMLAHTLEYIKLVEKECLECEKLGVPDGVITLSTGDVQICPVSYQIALLAVGGVLVAVDAVFENKWRSVFCVVRPPGHHACSSVGMGFCLFNNVAIGARYALLKYNLKRVLIVDWDVHHGNGTQEIFYNDSRVFYFSTHQWLLYPGTGSSEETGVGNILNVPISAGKQSRTEILQAFSQNLTQAMETFQPECVFISAGFDAHYRDPLGGLNLNEQDFGELTRIVKGIAKKYAQNRIISVLEGGYDLIALSTSSVEHIKALNEGG